MTISAAYDAWLRARFFPALAILLLGVALALPMPSTALAQEDPAQRVTLPQRFTIEVIGPNTGEAQDVILIPGLSTPRDVWLTAAQQLAPDYRLHLLQIRGFGDDAGANAEGPILDDLVEELAEYIEANDLGRPAIVGHSLGGLAALMLGARHPDLPGRLMIVDALPWYGALVAPGAEVTMEMIRPQAAMFRDAAIAQHGQTISDEMRAAQLRSQVLDQSNLPTLIEWSRATDMRVAGQLVYEDITTDMRQDIAQITVPVTMLFPYNATYPTLAQAEPFYRAQYSALPSAQFIGIGPSGHFIMLDKPEAFQAELAAFLGG